MKTVIRRIKTKVGSFIKDPGSDGPSPHQEQIDALVSAQFATLSASRIKLEYTNDEVVENGRDPQAPFANFLTDYYRQIKNRQEGLAPAAADPTRAAVVEGIPAEIVTLKEKHPFLCDFSDMAIDYLKKCDLMPPTISPLLRRHFFRFISFLRGDASHIFDYKRNLPRVGLCYFPNPGPKQFLIDALAGMADIDDMEPGKMVELAWQRHGKDIDYAAYHRALKKRTEAEIAQLPEEFVAHFPSREYLVNEMAAATQYQWALVELLKDKHWDLIFMGASEAPLGLAFFDLPRQDLPPVITICHGIPTGDPLMSFFSRLDRVVVRGETERDFYANLGIPESNMIFVGSTSAEDFPARSAVRRNRANARAALGLDDDDTVICYGSTYDLNLYNTKSPEEIMDMLLSAFKAAVEKYGLKNPVLFIKYHPAPGTDPHFSFSRNQYPFLAFGKLEEQGYRVRLAASLEQVIPASDCFIAHESTTLTDAIDRGIPTISIKIHKGVGTPFLGRRTYTDTDCHKLFTVWDSPDQLGHALQTLCTLDKDSVYDQSRDLWKNLFGTGRSHGLIKIGELAKELLASKT